MKPRHEYLARRFRAGRTRRSSAGGITMSSGTILAKGKGPTWCMEQDFSAASAVAPVRFGASSSRLGPRRHLISTCTRSRSTCPVRTATRENGDCDTTRDSHGPSSFRIAKSVSRPSSCFSCISQSDRILSARVAFRAGRFRACDPDSPTGAPWWTCAHTAAPEAPEGEGQDPATGRVAHSVSFESSAHDRPLEQCLEAIARAHPGG